MNHMNILQERYRNKLLLTNKSSRFIFCSWNTMCKEETFPRALKFKPIKVKNLDQTFKSKKIYNIWIYH